jgi:membrane protease YdiL (CAAX protease family)
MESRAEHWRKAIAPIAPLQRRPALRELGLVKSPLRPLLFGQLYSRARLGFWPSALIPALIFAACHLQQSNEPLELLGIFAITALGSVLSSWFFIRFGGNLWAPVALHALMNTWWMVFTSNQSALGGYADNVFRFASIALALRIVRWFAPARARA